MSLSQLRELSIIATPPTKRLPIKTYVQKRNNTIIREAIMREISRGGQVYFVHNNVAQIGIIASQLKELVPEANIEIGHGRMHEKDLECVITGFYRQHFNVLVCTTIIENGLDIPTANTIIMDRADRFGLAQLHQLRGRVGRSYHQAYAYLLVPDETLITRDAEKRLEAISTADALGIGFNLATQDMEIRGAGQLLGDEQSGQIETIGFSLYMEYLETAINALKSDQPLDFNKPLIQHTDIDLQTSAIIPEGYIPNVNTRLGLYKRIASAKNTEKLDDLQVEMIDRFGLLPEETKRVFKLAELKLIALTLGIDKIHTDKSGASIEFDNDSDCYLTRLTKLVTNEPTTYRPRGSNTLKMNISQDNFEDRFDAIKNTLELISKE